MEEEDKALLMLTLFSNFYDNLVAMLQFGKDIVRIKDITSSLLSNEIRKRTNLEEEQDFGLVGRHKITIKCHL